MYTYYVYILQLYTCVYIQRRQHRPRKLILIFSWLKLSRSCLLILFQRNCKRIFMLCSMYTFCSWLKLSRSCLLMLFQRNCKRIFMLCSMYTIFLGSSCHVAVCSCYFSAIASGCLCYAAYTHATNHDTGLAKLSWSVQSFRVRISHEVLLYKPSGCPGRHFQVFSGHRFFLGAFMGAWAGRGPGPKH